MRFMKTTAVALALAVGGLCAPISSPFTGTDPAAAERRVVKKRVVRRPNGNRIVNQHVVIRRPGVRVVDGRYWYGSRYYGYDEALAAGLIGFTLVAPAPVVVTPAPVVVVPAPVVVAPAPYYGGYDGGGYDEGGYDGECYDNDDGECY